MSEYWDKSYNMKVEHQSDSLVIKKMSGSDWSQITLFIHKEEQAKITIRSKEMAEHLHFMLGKMLSNT